MSISGEAKTGQMKKMKVILIEDDPGIREAMQMVFVRAGYETIIYPDGMTILEGNFPLPDLFIIDKQLSGVDGLDICQHLKKKEETRHIPVIMMSATPHIGKLAKEVCADDFIEKPFKNKHLLEMVAKHMQ